GGTVYVVEMRLLVPLPGVGVSVELSKAAVLPFVPFPALVVHDDLMSGTAEGLTVARVGWLPTRGHFVCRVTDSRDPATIGDARAVLGHYAARGWVITGGGPTP